MSKKIVLSLLFVIFAAAMYAQKEVTVKINYGEGKTAESVKVEWHKGMTAMDALQKCATIETYPAKGYVFVSSINGIRNVLGDNAWYYKVNGSGPGKTSFRLIIKSGDTIEWNYTKDVCSQKVDKK